MARRQPTVQTQSIAEIRKAIDGIGEQLDAFKGAGTQDVTAILQGRATTIERTLATDDLVAATTKKEMTRLEASRAGALRLSKAFVLARGRVDDTAAPPDDAVWLVEGTALDDALKPLASVDVELFVKQGARMRSLGKTTTDDEGNYTFDLAKEIRNRRGEEIPPIDTVVVVSKARKPIASRAMRLTPRGGARDRVDVFLKRKANDPPR